MWADEHFCKQMIFLEPEFSYTPKGVTCDKKQNTEKQENNPSNVTEMTQEKVHFCKKKFSTQSRGET